MSIPAYVAFRQSAHGTSIHGVLCSNRAPYLCDDDDELSNIDEKDIIALNHSQLSDEFKIKLIEAAKLTSPDLNTKFNGGIGSSVSKLPNDSQMQVNQIVNSRPVTNLQVPLVARIESGVNINYLPDLPSCPWFNPNGIAQQEVDELSHSFLDLKVIDGKSPVDINNRSYINLRNTLIDVYRSKPHERLTLAECRKHCDGDLSTLIRFLCFLERHRLVNYALELPSKMDTVEPVTKKLKEELSAHWTDIPTCSACDRLCIYNFYVLSPAVYGSWFPFSTIKTAVWCTECAMEAPNNQYLLKVNLPVYNFCNGSITWNQNQLYALLDAIEANGSDWIEISKIVSAVPGSPERTPRECLAAFLALPVTEKITSLDKYIKNKPIDPEMEFLGLKLLIAIIDSLKKNLGSEKVNLINSLDQLNALTNDKINMISQYSADQSYSTKKNILPVNQQNEHQLSINDQSHVAQNNFQHYQRSNNYFDPNNYQYPQQQQFQNQYYSYNDGSIDNLLSQQQNE